MQYNLKEVKIEVTQKCPLNCIHCSSEANKIKKRKLNEEIVKNIINDAKEMNAEEIVFSGGEPLEWEPLCRCIALSKNLGLNTIVYTTCNGFLNCDYLFDNFIKSGVDNVVVSLFGANQKEHEKVTRINGSFDNTISGIKRISAKGISVSVHFVAMKLNWRQLAGVVNLVEDLKVKKVSVLRFVPHGRGEIIKDTQNLSREELKDLKKEIIRLRENPNVLIRLGSPFNILSLQADIDCKAAIDRIIVGSDGIVYPCDAFKNIIPESKLISIEEGSLKEIWNKSEYLNDVRQKVKKGLCNSCSVCINRTKCKGGCLAQKIIRFDGKYEIPDPDCMIQRPGDVYEQLKLEI